MTIKDLTIHNELVLLNDNIDLSTPISNFYSCDLLSWILGNLHQDNYCLITIIDNLNVIAVAKLKKVSCIIFSCGVNPSKEVISKATDENIAIFKTSLSSFDIAKVICSNESLL